MGPKLYVKFRRMPGDIPKQDKIKLLERKNKDEASRSRSYRREIRSRERAVLKRRFAKIIDDGI